MAHKVNFEINLGQYKTNLEIYLKKYKLTKVHLGSMKSKNHLNHGKTAHQLCISIYGDHICQL